MKSFVTTLLFFMMLGSMTAYGVHKDNNVDGFQKIQNIDGPTIASAHDCNGQENGSHHGSSSCMDCHLHGHCHCRVLMNGITLPVPPLASIDGISSNLLHPNPYYDNLLRPPIV